MDNNIQSFRNLLRPIFEMLRHRRSYVSDQSWILLVHETKHRVIQRPEEYLAEIPEKEMLVPAVQHLFKEFINESI